MPIIVVKSNVDGLIHGTIDGKKTGCGIRYNYKDNIRKYSKGDTITDLVQAMKTLNCEKCRIVLSNKMIKEDRKAENKRDKEERKRIAEGIKKGIIKLDEDGNPILEPQEEIPNIDEPQVVSTTPIEENVQVEPPVQVQTPTIVDFTTNTNIPKPPLLKAVQSSDDGSQPLIVEEVSQDYDDDINQYIVNPQEVKQVEEPKHKKRPLDDINDILADLDALMSSMSISPKKLDNNKVEEERISSNVEDVQENQPTSPVLEDIEQLEEEEVIPPVLEDIEQLEEEEVIPPVLEDIEQPEEEEVIPPVLEDIEELEEEEVIPSVLEDIEQLEEEEVIPSVLEDIEELEEEEVIPSVLEDIEELEEEEVIPPVLEDIEELEEEEVIPSVLEDIEELEEEEVIPPVLEDIEELEEEEVIPSVLEDIEQPEEEEVIQSVHDDFQSEILEELETIEDYGVEDDLNSEELETTEQYQNQIYDEDVETSIDDVQHENQEEVDIDTLEELENIDFSKYENFDPSVEVETEEETSQIEETPQDIPTSFVPPVQSIPVMQQSQPQMPTYVQPQPMPQPVQMPPQFYYNKYGEAIPITYNAQNQPVFTVPVTYDAQGQPRPIPQYVQPQPMPQPQQSYPQPMNYGQSGYMQQSRQPYVQNVQTNPNSYVPPVQSMQQPMTPPPTRVVRNDAPPKISNPADKKPFDFSIFEREENKPVFTASENRIFVDSIEEALNQLGIETETKSENKADDIIPEYQEYVPVKSKPKDKDTQKSAPKETPVLSEAERKKREKIDAKFKKDLEKRGLDTSGRFNFNKH